MIDLIEYLPYISVVVEVGEIKFSLRRMCPQNCTWISIGHEPGVDDFMIELSIPLPDRYADAVVSSQLENDPFFWNTFVEMIRVCRPGGHIFLVSRGLGIWSFSSLAWQALAAWAEECDFPIELVEFEDKQAIFRRLG